VVLDRDPAPVIVLVEFDEQPRAALPLAPGDVLSRVERVQGLLPLPQVLGKEPGLEGATDERRINHELSDQGIRLGGPLSLLLRSHLIWRVG
jgi:hypothetical protein